MKINIQTLWLFADSMARCLEAGLPVQRALESSRAGLRSGALVELTRVARERCDQGMSVAEALEPGAKVLPHYFLPVIRAGEASGRLVESFQLLHQHCHRIAPSVRLVRNTWLYPLICIVAGWIARMGIFLYFGRSTAAAHFFWMTFGMSSVVVFCVWLLLKIPAVKGLVDALLLQIPVVRETELGLGTALFFSTFRLAYEAGGLGVVVMFDLASETVRNSAIRRDLARARQVLVEHGTFEDAFAQLTHLEDRFKGMIAAGSIGGQLEQSLTHVVELLTQELEVTLKCFNNIFQRVVSLTVALSIAETVMICTMF